MNLTLPGAMLAGALAAACLIALADPPRKHPGTNTISEVSTTLPSANSAGTLRPEDVTENVDANVGAPLRGSHDSMHPRATQAPASADRDGMEAPQKTSD